MHDLGHFWDISRPIFTVSLINHTVCMCVPTLVFVQGEYGALRPLGELPPRGHQAVVVAQRRRDGGAGLGREQRWEGSRSWIIS